MSAARLSDLRVVGRYPHPVQPWRPWAQWRRDARFVDVDVTQDVQPLIKQRKSVIDEAKVVLDAGEPAIQAGPALYSPISMRVSRSLRQSAADRSNRSRAVMTSNPAGVFAETALLRIAELFEDHAVLAARRLPAEERERDQLLKRLRAAGLEAAALAHGALALG